MKVELVRVTQNPVQAMALAGANCYNSKPHEGIVDHCYKSGHHSILEFVDFHFHIEGVSRSLSHQLIRHRLASYSQKSQRYVNEENFEHITPKSIKNNQQAKKMYDAVMLWIKRSYSVLIKLGVPQEDARMILPNACTTTIDVKMNLRSLIHFMNLRLCVRSQWEIRQLAEEIRRVVIEKYPELGKYLVPKCEINAPYCFCTEEATLKNPCRYQHISNSIKGGV